MSISSPALAPAVQNESVVSGAVQLASAPTVTVDEANSSIVISGLPGPAPCRPINDLLHQLKHLFGHKRSRKGRNFRQPSNEGHRKVAFSYSVIQRENGDYVVGLWFDPEHSYRTTPDGRPMPLTDGEFWRAKSGILWICAWEIQAYFEDCQHRGRQSGSVPDYFAGAVPCLFGVPGGALAG